MIQQFGQRFYGRLTRKGVAVLLTFWLNLALLPCALAIDAPEKEHDCCPPTIELLQSDCCELEAVAPEKRGGKLETSDDLPIYATIDFWPSLHTTKALLHEASPPDPVNYSPPLHKLFCVYLD
jgi:hypothetical protein